MPVHSTALQERLDEACAKYGVPGASLAVLDPSGTTAVASGVLNLGTGVEATPDSLFQIGSITKVWTATVVMQLVDEGLVGLDEPVRRYLPEFRVADSIVSETVTIRHLLAHSSGIDGDHLADTGRGDDVLERYVESCAPLRQVHPLGSTMSYCNTGYSVLGRVIEVVTGSVWDAAVQARLAEPLGLTHTATLPEDVLRHRAAYGHIRPPGHDPQLAPAWGLPRSLGPAGLICTTASELVAFAQLHLRDGRAADGSQLLAEGSAQAMRTAQIDVPSGGHGFFPPRWGLGWAVYDCDGHAVVGHDGQTIGQVAFLRVVPDTGAAVALLTNGGDAIAMFGDIGRVVLDEVGGVEMPPTEEPPEAQPAVDPARYAGVYEREGARIVVAARDGQLMAVQTVTGPAAAMTPDPFELRLFVLDAHADLFLTRHPAAPDVWLPVKFLTLSDGSRCLHVAGRATPEVT